MTRCMVFLTLAVGGWGCSGNPAVTNDSSSTRYDTMRYAREYYSERRLQFSREPVVKGSIVMIGNSMIEHGEWRKLLRDSTVINRGIGGDNTFGVLERLDDVLVLEPSKIIMEIGINDVSQGIPVDVIAANIVSIVRRIHEVLPNTRIAVVSLLPTNDDVRNEYPDAYGKNHLSAEVNVLIKQVAAADFEFINLSDVLSDNAGQLDRKYAMPDGLHLNEKGYELFAEAMRMFCTA